MPKNKDKPHPKHYEDIDTGVVFTCPICKKEMRILHRVLDKKVKHGIEE